MSVYLPLVCLGKHQDTVQYDVATPLALHFPLALHVSMAGGRRAAALGVWSYLACPDPKECNRGWQRYEKKPSNACSQSHARGHFCRSWHRRQGRPKRCVRTMHASHVWSISHGLFWSAFTGTWQYKKLNNKAAQKTLTLAQANHWVEYLDSGADACHE